MIRVEPIVERFYAECPFWESDQDEFYLPVRADLTPAQVGAVVWALVGSDATDEDGKLRARSATEAIEPYLIPDEDRFAAGGLRVSSGGVVVNPGCCVGLEEWRDWAEALTSKPPWFGHDPDVLLERRDQGFRLWKNGRTTADADPHIDLTAGELAALIDDVQAHLVGFLAALSTWALDVVPALADRLVAAVDSNLRISGPVR